MQLERLGTQGTTCQVSNPSEEEDFAVLALGGLEKRWAPSGTGRPEGGAGRHLIPFCDSLVVLLGSLT